MRVDKKVLAKLTKCYSVAPLNYRGSDCYLVAAEKVDRCILFDADGKELDTVWTEPGGVMSMVQVPGTDGQFLATHKFYSPNDGADASIVIVTPGTGGWERRTLVKLPYVHRFDILQSGGRRYLIACTIKTQAEYKDDWRFPGKVYAAELPEDLSGFNDDNQLELHVIKDNMLKNHGYCRICGETEGGERALVCADNGIFIFTPGADGTWSEEKLSDMAASDALFMDLDGDGERELVVLSPFHGDTLSVLKKQGGQYVKVYEYPEKIEFLHAVCSGTIGGRPCAIIGWRKGARNLLALRADGKAGYTADMLDTDCGPANALYFSRNGKDCILCANRETDEIALYTVSE